MRLPKTKARAAPSLLRCERSRNRKSRDLEREVPTQPLGVYQATPREAGMGQRGEGHSAGL